MGLAGLAPRAGAQGAAGGETQAGPPRVDEPAKPQDVIVSVQGVPYTRQQFIDWLMQSNLHSSYLRQYVDHILVENEAKRLGIQVTEADAMEKVIGELEQLVDARYQGDWKAMRDDFARRDVRLEDYVRERRYRAMFDKLRGELARRNRQSPTENEIQGEYQRQYGPYGMKARVRHIFAARLRAKPRLGADGKPVTDANAIDNLMREQIQQAKAALDAGRDFAAVAREFSDDLATKDKGGEIPGYNFRQYGTAFADAVRNLEPGQTSEPVHTAQGYHLIQVLEKSVHPLEEVRADIIAQLLTREPNPVEMQRVLTEIRQRAKIEYP